jgi:diaminopimelate epimerase
MRVAFTKMHGLGNDFIVLELPSESHWPAAERWRELAHRHTGIGFDQALVLLPPRRPDTDVFYRIINADGGEVEQCGNGARCIAALLHSRGRGAGAGATLSMDSAGGILKARFLDDGRVSVNLGPPDFDPASLPFKAAARSRTYRTSIDGQELEFGAVSMGNPHAVVQVPSITDAAVEHIGGSLQRSPLFPRQVNVGFMQVLDAGHIRLRVYERGVGETLACGTGACAAAVIGHHLGLLGPDVEVHVTSGVLSVHWEGDGEPVWLTGPAQQSFEGYVEI